MKISRLKISNYRSIERIDIDCDDLLVLCGANSAGKSNILTAIELAFRREYSLSDAQSCIPRTNSGPRTLIKIEIEFSEVPDEVEALAPTKSGQCKYVFQLSRKANVYKRLNGADLDTDALDVLERHFSVSYIPATRDLNSDESNPLSNIIHRQIYSGTTNTNINSQLMSIRAEVESRATALLAEQTSIAKSILGVDSLSVSTDLIQLEDLHERVGLTVSEGNQSYSLDQLGSGHQNIVLIGLFRQLSNNQSGSSLLLIEEPDAHLHPPAARAIAEELAAASMQAQIFLTSHSSALINHLGLAKAQYVSASPDSGTHLPSNNFQGTKADENVLMRHGIRLAEALFSKMVILVEGISDATVFSNLIESRYGRSLSSLDVLLIPMNGKGEVPQIAGILNRLGVVWLCILDFDAAYRDESVPIVSPEARQREIEILDNLEVLKGHIDATHAILDGSTKRGRNAQKNLAAIRDELENGCPTLTYLDGSVLERLIDQTIGQSTTGKEQLRRELRNNSKRAYRASLINQNVILLNPDLEHAITSKEANLAIIESILRNNNLITSGVPKPCSRELLITKLHSIGSHASIYSELVNAIESNSGFSKTEINACMKLFTDKYLKPLGIIK